MGPRSWLARLYKHGNILDLILEGSDVGRAHHDLSPDNMVVEHVLDVKDVWLNLGPCFIVHHQVEFLLIERQGGGREWEGGRGWDGGSEGRDGKGGGVEGRGERGILSLSYGCSLHINVVTKVQLATNS